MMRKAIEKRLHEGLYPPFLVFMGCALVNRRRNLFDNCRAMSKSGASAAPKYTSGTLAVP